MKQNDFAKLNNNKESYPSFRFDDFDYIPPSYYNDINAPINTNTSVNPLTNNVNTDTKGPAGVSTNPPNNIPRIANNQISIESSLELSMINRGLRSTSQTVNCPYCKNIGMTRTEKQISFPNVVCCGVFTAIPWMLFQIVRGKDINPCDVSHYCTRCGANLSNYKAC